jgi:hypothetical protein
MTRFRLVSLLALTLASLAAPAMAQLPMDPELLPPKSAPGDCVVRRVTGPGGAYRWDRVECERGQYGYGGGGHDQWGYGRNRLEVETRGEAFRNSDVGDRYGERRRDDRGFEEYERSRAYGEGYDQGRGGPVVSYPPSYAYGYVAAGRDEAGYLIWPGKTP